LGSKYVTRFTLASRNLFQDRLRFIASLIGIVFSVVLVMVQMGLYFGFGRMVTTVIDHASTDLWIVANGAKCFEDLSLLSTGTQNRLQAIDGVAEVIPVLVGYSAWMLPDGTMTPVFIIGSDFIAGGLSPWNVVEGTVQDLTAPGTVAVDRSYYGRLGVAGLGATAQIRGLPVTVGAVTDGIRSFTTTPYVFSDLGDARLYIGLPASFISHFLVRLKPKTDIELIRQDILANISGIQASFGIKADRSGFSEQELARHSLQARCSASLSALQSSHRHSIPAPKTIFMSSPRYAR
jgi:putative ABC transport system permease protein